MKKISFNGKEYVRVSDAAKKFRYTQDYVGQLCRNKKVDARRVGRNWYVTVESITAYRKTKHQTQKSTPAAARTKKAGAPSKKPQKRVEAVLRNKTIKNTQRTKTADTHQEAAYSNDDETLIPILSSTTQSAGSPVSEPKRPKVQLERTPSVALIVSSPKTETKFSSDKLPEISLSGKVSVIESDDERLGQEVAAEPSVSLVEVESEAAAPACVATSQAAQEVFFKPKMVQESAKSFPKNMPILVSSFVVACAASLLVLGVGSEMVVVSEGVTQGWRFDMRPLLEALFK